MGSACLSAQIEKSGTMVSGSLHRQDVADNISPVVVPFARVLLPSVRAPLLSFLVHDPAVPAPNTGGSARPLACSARDNFGMRQCRPPLCIAHIAG